MIHRLIHRLIHRPSAAASWPSTIVAGVAGVAGVVGVAGAVAFGFGLLASPLFGLEVTIASPSSLEPLFGQVEVRVEVHLAAGEAVAEMALTVDGVERQRRREPPWLFGVDVGSENRAHHFHVLARGQDGARAETTLSTRAIRIDDEVAVELQQLYVTASRRDGQRVLDLDAGDFRLFDDGVEQRLMTFARGDVAITAALLIDSSQSMRGQRLESAVRGARAFLEGLQARDESAVMLFSDRLQRTTPFTDQRQVLAAVLDDAEAAGNTAVNDALYLALQLLDGRQGRRVVVLFTDGADVVSVLDMDDVAWKARRSQALIYWLRLDDGGSAYRSFVTAWRDAAGNRRQVEMLEQVVEQSGGRIEQLDNLEGLEDAFRGILAELREHYVLGYQPSQMRGDGSWHEVEVRSTRSGVRLRARGGYVDE